MSGKDAADGREKSGGSCSVVAYEEARMDELLAEIARLEEQNEIIQRDRTECDVKFQRVLLRGNPRVQTEPIKSLKHPVAVEQDDLNIPSISSSEIEESLSPVAAGQNNPAAAVSVKKQGRAGKNVNKVQGTSGRKKMLKNDRSRSPEKVSEKTKMSRLDPEEVCCGLIENSKTAKPEARKEHTAKKSPLDKISQRNRIEQLEIQMARLAHDVAEIKNQHSRSSALIQDAIQRGMRSLGDRFIVSCSADENLGRSSEMSCCSESFNSDPSKVSKKEQKSTKAKKDCSEF